MPELNQIEISRAIHDGTVALSTAWGLLNKAEPDSEALRVELEKAEAACAAIRAALSNSTPNHNNLL